MRKHALRALSLSILAVVGLMAVAGVAQAENLSSGGTAGEFRILLAAVGGLLATLTGTQESTSTLLAEGAGIEILCAVGEIIEAGSAIESSTDAKIEILFKQCKVYEFGEAHDAAHELPCHVVDHPSEASSLHIRFKALLLPKLHNGELFVWAEPREGGKALATILFKKGTGCPLPLLVEQLGSVAFKVKEDGTPNLIETSKAIQLLLGSVLKWGVLPQYIDVSFNTALVAPHASCSFGVV